MPSERTAIALMRPGASHERGKAPRPKVCSSGPRVTAFTLALLLYVPSPSTAADSDRGTQLAAICAACHRLDGTDRDLPSIIGWDATKLAATMQAFRSGKRPSQIMHAMALSLTEDETAILARYLARRRAGP